MKYAELVDGEAKTSELKSFLVDGENVAVTIRIPKNRLFGGLCGLAAR